LGLVSSDCRNEYTGPSSTVGYCHIHVWSCLVDISRDASTGCPLPW
jgi:hypothetical protein